MIRTSADLFQVPNFLLQIIGFNLFPSDKLKKGMLIIRIIAITNLSVVIVGQTMYVIQGLTNPTVDIMPLMAAGTLAGFSILSQFKLFKVLSNQKLLQTIFNQFDELFPKTLERQKCYKVEKYQRQIFLNTAPLAGFLIGVVCIFNLEAIISSSYNYIQYGNFNQRFPYFIWYPFPTSTRPTVYSIIYLNQSFAALVSAFCMISMDVLLFCITLQICMQLDAIATDILHLKLSGTDQDCKNLAVIVRRHNIVLKLADNMNEMFTTFVFLHFISTSIFLCFTGFQVTTGDNIGNAITFCGALTFELMQIFEICYLGNFLIESGYKVGSAVYNHDWTIGNKKYQKMIPLIIFRSQKPASVFVMPLTPISLQSFTMVISTSYRVFTVLSKMLRET